MARPAPAVERTIRVLKYLARHPRERFSLSELSRNLDMNKATVHAMLWTLVDEGVLIRNPADKTYTLGPELIGLGNAAVLDASWAMELAMPEVVAISNDLDVSCVITAMVGLDVVILGRRDVGREIRGYLPVGHHIPAIPPQGREFMAWEPRGRVMEWLAQMPGAANESNAAWILDVLQKTRDLGYVLMTPEVTDLQKLLGSLTELNGARKLHIQLKRLISDLGDDTIITAGAVSSGLANAVISPVFGPSGIVILAIAISGFPPDAEAGDVKRFTERVCAGTEAITRMLHGHRGIPDWVERGLTG